ncbi:ArsA family ATPase [Sporichthya polymorpha]|uniref:ArsA family ATPase n=1 Tax=Sporichthya polymorpha TaxID=35751 RepID=UPI000378635C|nr:TRC40/GET3/ArsA family transport-energizing ATPase [Sporichthya polymorpha]
MRVLLFTGKGGVGKTTAAAGTATLAAARGRKTLVLSTDAAHSLADAFGVPPTAEPAEVAPNLFLAQVDAQRTFERTWTEIRRYLLGVLDSVGVDPIEAEELTVLPGAEEVLALLEVRDQVRSGRWDVVVVDCAPTAETLRLLALPEALNWYMDRVFPTERRMVRALRPVLNRVTGVPMPADGVFDAVERLHAELAAVREVLTDPGTSVRLVLTPESVVVAEARRTLTSLSLYGYRTDAVIANRIFPAEGADSWRTGWVAAQTAMLAEIEASFAPLPVLRSGYRAAEPVGPEELGALAAEIYASLPAGTDPDPCALLSQSEPMTIRAVDPGRYVLSLALPLADKRDMDLRRKGDELVLTVGGHRRLLALPSALARCTVGGAQLAGDRLEISFTRETPA